MMSARSMLCPKCGKDNAADAARCLYCGNSMAVAVLEVTRGDVPDKIRFLRPRSYTVGRARNNDLSLNEPSISKTHAHIEYDDRAASTASTSTRSRCSARS
jgi:hypothetical protein